MSTGPVILAGTDVFCDEDLLAGAEVTRGSKCRDGMLERYTYPPLPDREEIREEVGL